MRCPKCGYITFDHLETCPKCKKNIAKISEELSGNIFRVEVPLFLKFEVDEPEIEPESSVDVPVEEEDVELEMTVDGNDSPDVEFSFDEEDSTDDSRSFEDNLEEETVDAGIQEEHEETPGSIDDTEGGEDVVFAEDDDFSEFDLNEEDKKESTDGDDGLNLDFTDLDIADLAPPAAVEEDGEDTAEFVPGDEARATTTDSASPPLRGTSGAGLEDLQTDGFDLDLPASPLPESAAGKKKRSTVKTGTALDDFDFDLEDLIVDEEK